MSQFIAMIVAAGQGERFQSKKSIVHIEGGTDNTSQTLKQYCLIHEKPLLWYSLNAFLAVEHIALIVVVLSPDDRDYESILSPHIPSNTPKTPSIIPLFCGGKTRAESVSNALSKLPTLLHSLALNDWVLVHDAARPCIRSASIIRLIDQLQHHPIGGILAIPLVDTLKRAHSTKSGTSTIIDTPSREHLWCAQTPQMFRIHMLQQALADFPEATDDAAAIEKWLIGQQHPERPCLIFGQPENIKVTYAEDLERVRYYLT